MLHGRIVATGGTIAAARLGAVRSALCNQRLDAPQRPPLQRAQSQPEACCARHAAHWQPCAHLLAGRLHKGQPHPARRTATAFTGSWRTATARAEPTTM